MSARMLASSVLAVSSLNIDEYRAEWGRFQVTFARNYDSKEEAMRFGVFCDRLKRIEEMNNRNLSYKLGTNQFSDWTAKERAEYLQRGAQRPSLDPIIDKHNSVTEGLPSSVDWTTQGIVTPVKDQQSCGSCWAFSTTGVLESAWAKSTGSLLSFAEQQLVDCSGSGCNGGWPASALEWYESNVVCSEDSYKYTAKDGSCHQSSCTAALPEGAVTGYIQIDAGSEAALKSAVAQQPISVCVYATDDFMDYKSGILTGGCNGDINHAVLAVGYEAGSYWKLKNSWNTWWGEDGYIRLPMGTNPHCLVSVPSVYPTVSGAPSPPPTPPSPKNLMTIVNPESLRCLAITGDVNKARMELFDCWDSSPYLFQLKDGQVVNQGGKCLDIPDGRAEDGAPLQLYDCNGTPAQQWELKNRNLVNPASGKCVDIDGGPPKNLQNHAKVQLWGCWGASNQLWEARARTSTHLLHAGRACGSQTVNLGNFYAPELCGHAASANSQCNGYFMFAANYRDSWGCRCCGDDEPGEENDEWNMYSYTTSVSSGDVRGFGHVVDTETTTTTLPKMV